MLAIIFTTLFFGWNQLMGWGVPAADYAATHSECSWVSIFDWQPETQTYDAWYSNGPEWANDFDYMEWGEGYWVYCGAP